MSRRLSFLWLALMLIAGAYLGQRVLEGVHFRTDLMALLPQEDQDPAIQHANDTVSQALSRRVLLMVGHKDRTQARDAAQAIGKTLADKGVLTLATTTADPDRLKALGAQYFPHRLSLLSDSDRAALKDGKGNQIAERALAQVYGFFGGADAALLSRDPFLLASSFFTSLPTPFSKLKLDEGLLSVQEQGQNWVLLVGELTHPPYELETQETLRAALDPALSNAKVAAPGLEVLQLGAVFFAEAGAKTAMDETSNLGTLSLIGTILLVLVVFRTALPLLLSLLVLGISTLAATSFSLLIFGELHVLTLVFGVSLIGVAVDYCLEYCTEVFSPVPMPPRQRLERVFSGITLGMATTVIGYLMLLLAPFPGLHQIAVFSAAGLIAAWATVILWLPSLDRLKVPRHRAQLLRAMDWVLTPFPFQAHYRHWLPILLVSILVAIPGYLAFKTEDDVRRMQSISPDLAAQQERIQRLIGASGSQQFFLVQAPDDETALRMEETLITRLQPLVSAGNLGGFQAPSQFVPSIARQTENRTLVQTRLIAPHLNDQKAALGLDQPMELPFDAPPLMLKDVMAGNTPLAALKALILSQGSVDVLHVVTLDGVTAPAAVRTAATGLTGVRFVDPAGDFSDLLGKYRNRAVMLLGASALLLLPLLAWRYGRKGAIWVLLPPVIAVCLTPAVRAMTGGVFTFFDAMALILVLSCGVDYTLFFAEVPPDHRAVTMVSVTLAAVTSMLSFGLLAFSEVLAVRSFGLSMLIGTIISFALAPLAVAVTKRGAPL